MHFRDAPATYGIAILTVAVSVCAILFVAPDVAAVTGGFIPGRVPDVPIANYAGWLVPVWLTPLSATLLHGGWMHLFFNMVMLVYCGREAERALGSVSIAALYVIGAYAAAAGQWAQDPGAVMPMIGASGAISALVAAYAMLYGGSRTPGVGPLPAGLIHALWLGAAWTGINLLIGFATMMGQPVAIGAHIGGFIVGLVLARPLLLWRYRKA